VVAVAVAPRMRRLQVPLGWVNRSMHRFRRWARQTNGREGNYRAEPTAYDANDAT